MNRGRRGARLARRLNPDSSPDVSISGAGANYVLLLRTYLTRDRITVEAAFVDDTKFTVTQEMWLTPELEAQIEAMPASSE